MNSSGRFAELATQTQSGDQRTAVCLTLLRAGVQGPLVPSHTGPRGEVMSRRAFTFLIVGALAGVALSSKAQQAKARPKVGYLSPFSAAGSKRWLDAFRVGLREQGYAEGTDVDIEVRFADEHYERLTALASELINRKIDVLFAITTPAAVAARRATASIPIVFTLVSDPVRAGLVTTLAHLGGNVTGTTDVTADLVAKRLALLKEAIPGLTRVGVLGNPDNQPTMAIAIADLERTAKDLGLDLQTVNARRASDLDRAFAALSTANLEALVVVADASLAESMPAIVRTAASHRLPVMGWNRSWAESGAILAYGTDAFELQREAAAKVAKILNGARAGELPLEQPTKFEFVINLRTAKALGITIPQSLLLRANDVIQ
jgi:putative ABC transport system substrate-binding protein